MPTAKEMRCQMPTKPEIVLTNSERVELQYVMGEIKANARKGSVWIPKLISTNIASKLRAYPFNYYVTLYPRSCKGPETIIVWACERGLSIYKHYDHC